MSLTDVWLARGKKINIGGRELTLMPLPLSRLVQIGHWLQDNCNAVVQEVLYEMKAGGDAPNPLALVSRVLLRVDISEVALELFSIPKDAEGKPLNPNLSKEFFSENLDIPTAHELYNKFVELNQLESLVKNLQSLPVVRKILDAAMTTFGIPYLNSLPLSTNLDQKTSEGSPIPKSTDTLEPTTFEKQETGNTSQELPTPPLAQKPPYLQ
jgi:hypothetical protein